MLTQRCLLVVACLLLSSGCATTRPDAEERLSAALPVPRGMEILEREQYGDVTCGRYSARSVNGFSTVTRPFIVTGERVYTNPRERDVAVLCSRNPVQALRREMQLWPEEDGDWGHVRRVHDDLTDLARAIKVYRQTHVAQPRTLALLRDEPDLADVPLRDPWGYPYRFRREPAGLAEIPPDLASLGSDGKAGGSGPAADIHFRDLPLIEHVLLIEGY